LDARLTTLLCNKNTVAKSKEVKTRCKLAESSKEGHISKKAVLPMMIVTMMIISCSSLGLRSKRSLQRASAGLLLGPVYDPENGGEKFLENIRLSPNYMAF
jgi:hypothetical protein